MPISRNTENQSLPHVGINSNVEFEVSFQDANLIKSEDEAKYRRTTLRQSTAESEDGGAANHNNATGSKSRLIRIYDLTDQFESSSDQDCKKSVIDSFKECTIRSRKCASACDKDGCKKMVKKRVPIIGWLPKYKLKSFLFADIMAGLTVGVMNIPQGLAYALLATLNPIYGLYVSFFPIIIYTMFGTCKHLIIGKYIYI